MAVFYSGCHVAYVIGKLLCIESLDCNITQLRVKGISGALNYSETSCPVSASPFPLDHGHACESSLID